MRFFCLLNAVHYIGQTKTAVQVTSQVNGKPQDSIFSLQMSSFDHATNSGVKSDFIFVL